MHELGVVCEVLKTVQKIVEQEKVSKIEKIVLQVGELSGIVPAYLEECFPAAVYKTPFEGTKLEMEVIPGEVKCKDCSEVFNGLKHNLKCPKCKGEHLDALSGREFIIKEILAC
ncbi:hydrogenase maturation nickel metallochaperone HypA [Treponema sp. OMZ 840]|uniref:hydrogenase maturation nickel metallochaperone HypA/HybF n=1 Tax=Treponema sp. OMZ 840 TaxID=244313 RepID=UPI003D8C9AC3